MGVCYCLQTCNLVVNMVVAGLVIGQSLMAISTTSILLNAKVCPFYNIVGMHPYNIIQSTTVLCDKGLYCESNSLVQELMENSQSQ